MSRINWQQYFMLIAKIISLRSTCNSRPGGAIIVRDNRILATGFTGTVAGTPQCSDKGKNFCYRRSVNAPDVDKYNTCPSIHAEANAINYAAKYGISIDESIMYCTLQPCYICLKQIASAGIEKVYFELAYESKDKKRDTVWKNAFSEFGIPCEQLSLNSDTIRQGIAVIINVTSTRRLMATK